MNNSQTPQKIKIGLKTNLPNKDTQLLPYTYHTQFYNNDQCKDIFNYLKTLNYDFTYYHLFGKQCKSPRKMVWFAEDPSWTYCFSRNHINGLPVNPFTPELIKIKDKVEKFTGKPFNALLINVYNPADRIDWHSDDDPWLGDQFIVPGET